MATSSFKKKFRLKYEIRYPTHCRDQTLRQLHFTLLSYIEDASVYFSLCFETYKPPRKTLLKSNI